MRAEPYTIAELSRALDARAVTSEAIVERCLSRIAEHDSSINAFITVLADQARADARAADREIAAERRRGPLHGVPISIKDLMDLRGAPTTAASRVRQGHIAQDDAAVVARLRAAGAIFIGKTNLHEFAFGTTNEDSAYGPVHHPLDHERSPGGSSGGSAASILADMAYASIGTDTGGSIRIPAALCGLVGLKATLGEIPTDGVVPLSTTMDHVGPLCRSVEDAAILHGVLSLEPTPATAGARVRGLRLGVPRRYFLEMLDDQVAAIFESVCGRLGEAGVVFTDVDIPHAAELAPVYLHIGLTEVVAFHAATLESRPNDYTPNVRLRMEMGRYILAEDYFRALRGREVLTSEVDSALSGLDGLLLPTMAVPAMKLGAATVKVGKTEEPVRNVMLRLTQLFNVTGHPAISVPCGVTREGLPVGAQVAGRRARTPELLRVAAALEPHLR